MFVVSPQDSDPLYVQLYKQIREHVLSGKMPAGSKLPSVRDLSGELAVSRNTVESAYLDLHAEGYIHTRPRSGYFVSALDHDAAPVAPKIEPAGKEPPRQPHRQPPHEPEEPLCRYDFHPARLDPESFPLALWRKYSLECLRESALQLTQYRDPRGEPELRRTIRDYLERSRGVTCDPEQVVVTSGLQQSLEIVAGMARDACPTVAVENPGYFLPRCVFGNHGFGLVPIPAGPGGLDLDRLHASGAGMVYVTPSHQFPLGQVMPVGNRLKLIDWARAGDRIILEDDYDSELRYQGKPIPSLQGLAPGANIVYLGTFSKILSPALRLSYMVLPPTLLGLYRERFRQYQASGSFLEQATLARFMELGHWDRHIRRMRTLCRKKHALLLRAVERHFQDRAAVTGQGAGLHVVLRLQGDHPGEEELVRLARDAGIRLFPFSETLIGGGDASGMLLLGFGGIPAGEIDPGVALLARICSG